MEDSQLLRYSRQIMLPQIGIEGQQRLLDATVLIIGMGGLGSPAAMYLAAAGVGTLILADYDIVELSNLQRQIIHSSGDIGQPKVASAAATLSALNPECVINCINHRMTGDELLQQVKAVDLVLDCSDNFDTRFAVNQACVTTATPLVSGAAIRWEGQVSVFSNRPGDPCYHCLYGENGAPADSCSENGVLAPVVGIIGSVQATEAIKLLTGAGEALNGRLLILDALSMQWRSMGLKIDPNCPTCANRT